MAKDNITLGRKASIFYDPTTGLKIIKGEVVALDKSQLASRRVKGAINSGHLVRTDKSTILKRVINENTNVGKSPNISPVGILKKNLDELIAEGKDADDIAKAFKLTELKELAPLYDVDVEEGDTKKVIVSAILGEELEDEELEDEELEDEE